jgi:hypothetical protein
MVTSDSGLFLLRLSSHLLFLHFISRPINCILFSISNNPIPFIDVPGLRREVVFLSFWTGPGLQSHRGLVCNAVRRMTLRGLLTRVHETCDWTSRAGFGRTIRKSRLRRQPGDSTSGISSIGSSIISYSKGIPLADFASTSYRPPLHCC